MLNTSKVYLSDHSNCPFIADQGSSRLRRSICLRQCDDPLHEGFELLQGIPATGMQSVRSFDCPGVHRVVVGCCIFFRWVLATGFVFPVISHICNVVLIVSPQYIDCNVLGALRFELMDNILHHFHMYCMFDSSSLI
jgi:hypothetical protein